MSKRNTQEAKRVARERLKAEREKQAKRESMRRQLTVGGIVAGVLVLAVLVGFAIANLGGGGDSTDWEAVAADLEEQGEDASYAIPANASGEDGLTISIGDEGAEDVFSFYEEPRCPACSDFERATGEAVAEGIEAGDFRAEWTFGAFFDEQMNGGTGSKNAISALGAALDVSPEAFLGYLHALYSEEFHTSTNRADDFGDDDRLIEIGRSVEALSDDAAFDQFEESVRESTFAAWSIRMGEKFSAEPEITGTPTVLLNGERVETPRSAEELRALVG
ncbi:thioredoxin domain-containing protein [Streptomyces alkaliphilus]|uniref:thioredoxin domain-containing protein n=1 Tax=Streptomyces alkaliphilus TaxID=1472722 RepID=UPI00117C55B6|nr:thioredoxin domain-containing protein [Streptomyces alkaliphilus]MQS10043.1 thioredoxin domain-containing protein [Streptomyces alkaliphilus]